jgi:hypothetical protein
MEYMTENRNKQILEMRKEGKTYTQLADIFGISRERARQIVLKMESIGKHAHQEYYDALVKACCNLGYSEVTATRTYKCLLRAHIFAKMKAENLTLDDFSDYELLQIRNFGTNCLNAAREANYILTGVRNPKKSKAFKYQNYHEAFLKASRKLGYSSNSANRAYQALLNSGILDNIVKHGKSLRDYSGCYLMSIRGFGIRSLNIVRTAEMMM